MFEVVYKGLHTLVSHGETGHYIGHNMHSERPAITCFLYPGMATVHSIPHSRPTNIIYYVQCVVFPTGLIQKKARAHTSPSFQPSF